VKILDEVIESTKDLPEELQAEVRDFARFVKETRLRRRGRKMKLDWRGALGDMRDEFTSVELQHAISKWRQKHACS
jgi:hypothetical protein